jgi:hypothetical protein
MTNFDLALEKAYDHIAVSGNIDGADRLCVATSRLPDGTRRILEAYANGHTVADTARALVNGLIPF